TDLEKQGKLVRIHGGATISERKLQELTFSEKSTKNLQGKVNLAKYAASLVQKEDCIYLDAGSTVIQMIPYLEGQDIVVVTNGITHVEALIKHGITTYLIGGLMKAKTSALVGQQAIESLNNYRFDKCFLGVNGFHPTHEYTTPDPEEAAVNLRSERQDIVVVTNGITHVEALIKHGITTYLIGGLMKAKTSALVGQQAIESLNNYRFDKCFLGVNGFHPTHGYTTPDPEEAAVKL